MSLWLVSISSNIRPCKNFVAVTITFQVTHSRGKMYSGRGRLCVILSVPHRIPTLLHGLRCNLGIGSCALLGGFAIRARVSLL